MKWASFFGLSRLIYRVYALIFLVFQACHSGREEQVYRRPVSAHADSVYFSKEKFSILSLDSNRLFHFLDSAGEPASGKAALISFYKRRNYQFAWLENGSMRPAATEFFVQYRDFLGDYADSSIMDPVLDSLLYQLSFDGFENQGKAPLEELEMRTSLAFLRYARKEFTGVIRNPEALRWHIPKHKKNYPALLDSLAEGKMPGHFREPAHPYYAALKAALTEYKNIEKLGRWPRIPDGEPGNGNPDMSIGAGWLKQCLILTRDLLPADTLSESEAVIATALKRFQRRMGLAEKGLLDKESLEQLRVPLRIRQKQIMVNLERMRWLPGKIQGDFLLVNIPEFAIHVFREGKPIWHSRLVVGKQASKTQIFKGKISHIILNPTWGVPPGIVKKEILPGLKRHPDYLRRHHMQVFSGNQRIPAGRINWHRFSNRIPYTIRQIPGPENPLGRIKFLFPNSFWIYLHDSNEPWFFEAQKRTFSHGCIRMEKADKLAAYLFEKNAGMGPKEIQKALGLKKEAYFKLRKAEPVYIVYLTSWVDENGRLNFRPDVYGRDSLLYRAVFGNSDR
jgi:murein L,D-transpeptidase YcbB/YkuD